MLRWVPDAEKLVFPAGGLLTLYKGLCAQKALGRFTSSEPFSLGRKGLSVCPGAFHPAGAALSLSLSPSDHGRRRFSRGGVVSVSVSVTVADAVQVFHGVQALRSLRGARCLSVCPSVVRWSSRGPPVSAVGGVRAGAALLVLSGVDALGAFVPFAAWKMGVRLLLSVLLSAPVVVAVFVPVVVSVPVVVGLFSVLPFPLPMQIQPGPAWRRGVPARA